MSMCLNKIEGSHPKGVLNSVKSTTYCVLAVISNQYIVLGNVLA